MGRECAIHTTATHQATTFFSPPNFINISIFFSAIYPIRSSFVAPASVVSWWESLMLLPFLRVELFPITALDLPFKMVAFNVLYLINIFRLTTSLIFPRRGRWRETMLKLKGSLGKKKHKAIRNYQRNFIN